MNRSVSLRPIMPAAPVMRICIALLFTFPHASGLMTNKTLGWFALANAPG
jgi:hypothetical protein